MGYVLKPIVFTGPSPSELNRRITLEYPIKTPGGAGGFVTTWAIAATVWARITTLRTDEAILGMAQSGSAIHNIMIRYRTDINTSWRIGYGNRYYNIIGPPIDLNKAHRFLDIKVKEAA